MDNKRPMGHNKNVTGTSDVYKRGDGLGTGPVGTTNGRKSSGGSSSGGGIKRAGGGLSIIVIILALIFGKGFMGGGTDTGTGTGNNGDWQYGNNTAVLDRSVAEGSRAKYTQILGDGRDVVTIMVYMCGTDLESKHGMATADLQEMQKASLNDNVNIIVYTGGCKAWKNSVISNTKNQIYQVKNGGLVCLEKDMGSGAMTDPSNLTTFIKYCKDHFPANRNDLILWDHGGGSITGYGYDEKKSSSGSMNLAGIDKALKNAGVKFDFIGFDACLMATLENGLMLEKYADYLVASEETEPGVGWYYTNWLNELAKDTSKPTIEIGQKIVDDFVDVCAQKCRGQLTTLSIVDLAELKNTVPGELTDFAKSTNNLITNKDYQVVSDARYNTREFAVSSKIDQVDLVNLCENMKTSEGADLAKAIKGAVKYNRTSSNMTNAYGLAIYFPYKKASKVNNATSVYNQIDMDDEYTRCIKEFAGLEISGQQTTGGNTSPLQALTGGGSTASSSAAGSADVISSILSSLLSGSMSGLVSDRAMSMNDTADYLTKNYFDADNLVWTKDSDGKYKIKLSEKQWKLVNGLDLNVFVDDGAGYIDLGLDNQMEYDSAGNLIGEYDKTWLAVNNQVVAYYHTSTVGDEKNYTIEGYIPAMVNGERCELLVFFDNAHPDGYIAGARRVYADGETEAIAKNMVEIKTGDKIDFICDYYTYSGSYKDSYYLGEQLTAGSSLKLSYVKLNNVKTEPSYRFTDIYNQVYWTPVIP